jgi:hypothetical protein
LGEDWRRFVDNSVSRFGPAIDFAPIPPPISRRSVYWAKGKRMVSGVTSFVIFISEPPRIDVRRGVASVHLRSGDVAFEIAMPVPVMAKAQERASRAIKSFAAGQEAISIDD